MSASPYLAAALVALTAGTPAAADRGDLEGTMIVLDDLAEVGDGMVAPRTARDERIIDETPEEQDRTPGRFVDQFEAIDGKLEGIDETDHFEFDDEARLSLNDFETEGDFEEWEQVDLDVYEEPEDPDPAPMP